MGVEVAVVVGFGVRVGTVCAADVWLGVAQACGPVVINPTSSMTANKYPADGNGVSSVRPLSPHIGIHRAVRKRWEPFVTSPALMEGPKILRAV